MNKERPYIPEGQTNPAKEKPPETPEANERPREKDSGSFRELLQILKNKLIDISPDFLISSDKLLEDFEKQAKQSADLSESGGRFYNFLAEHALYKPNKEFSYASRESDFFESKK